MVRQQTETALEENKNKFQCWWHFVQWHFVLGSTQLPRQPASHVAVPKTALMLCNARVNTWTPVTAWHNFTNTALMSVILGRENLHSINRHNYISSAQVALDQSQTHT